ncbi:MAG: adenosylcobinamide-GDP ribazoletransferase [Deltaproteobacteria bacterium]|nr:adenosylcobinamide-GDP ribazoletransferase [Deltaproteobacteria bacterium]
MFARFEVAFQFLTRLPLFPARRFSSEELARSMGAFPLVGLALGAGLWVAHLLLGGRLPGLLEGIVLVALLAWATGAFHLDGVADTLDGLAGGWTPERALEIMKDSRIGAVGAVGLVLVLLAKVAAVGLLPGEVAGRALLLTPAVARGSVVWLAYGSTYARPTGGLGTPYTEHLDAETVRLALVGSGLPCLLLGWKGLIAFALTLAYGRVLKGWFHRRLGGITGDVLGFAEETGEVVFLLTVHLLA